MVRVGNDGGGGPDLLSGLDPTEATSKPTSRLRSTVDPVTVEWGRVRRVNRDSVSQGSVGAERKRGRRGEV